MHPRNHTKIHDLPFTAFMNSAFALTGTAPTSGARCLTELHRRRTRDATYRRIALVVKRVIWHVVLCDVVPKIVRRPCGKGIDLDKTEFLIPLDDTRSGAS